MAITKAKKQEIATKLTSIVKDASSLVFVQFNKLSVRDASAMRKSLKTEGVGFFVAKKTLIRRALSAAGYQGEIPELPGEVALAWTTGAGEVTAAARGIYTHAKKLKGALALVGGMFENAFRDMAGITAIATIPPVPVLRGMFVNVINSPIQGLVIALSKIAEQKQ